MESGLGWLSDIGGGLRPSLFVFNRIGFLQRMHRISEVDQSTRMAQCSICGPVYVHKDRQWWRCSVRSRHNDILRKYGLTPEQFRDMMDSQYGWCAICKEPLLKPHVDHDHQTGRARGLLCSNCNTGIGLFKEDPIILARAIGYLT